MIVFDTSFLVVLLQEKAPPVKDREDKPVPKARERLQHFVQFLSQTNSIICIPTPALAEIMVRAGNAGPEYLKRFRDSSKFRITAFDVRAAIDAADLIRAIKDDHKAQKLDTWAKVKFDIQIVAIAKAEGCGAIYSEDPHIENLGKRVNIPVRRICDLDLPPQEQHQQEGLFGP
jgi:predicted nucleic acid-binding protein